MKIAVLRKASSCFLAALLLVAMATLAKAGPVSIRVTDAEAGGMIGGKQAIHTHTQTANCEPLMAITKQYGLERVWINADKAAELGISDGDTVEVSNEQHTGKVQAKVTQRINPDALYMPSHYGCSSKEEKTAYGVGLRQMDYVPFRIEPGYGGICSQEAVVTVKKVGA